MNETSRRIPATGPGPERAPGSSTGPAERYAALALVANLVVVFWFALEGWGTLVVGLGLALGLLGIFARLRLALPLFLAWVLIVLYAQQAASQSQLSLAPQDATGSNVWILEAAVMVFLIAVGRLHALTVGVLPRPRDPRYFWTRLWRFWKGSGPRREELLRDPASCSASELWTVPLWALGWLLVAGLLLATLPAAETYAEYYGVDRRTMRSVLAAWLVVLLPALGAGALAYARWRKLSRREAGVYLRSVLWRWSYREEYAIARYCARRGRADSNAGPR